MQGNSRLDEAINSATQLARKLFISLKQSSENKQKHINNRLKIEDYRIIHPVHKQEEDKCKKQFMPQIENQKGVKKCYKAYSVQFKKRVVNQIKQESKNSKQSIFKIIRSKSLIYQVHPKNLSRWFKLEEIKKKEGGRKAAFPEIQQKLVKYMKQNPKYKRKTIIALAKSYLQETNRPEKDTFCFSKGWYERFKARHFPKVINNEEYEKLEDKVKALEE